MKQCLKELTVRLSNKDKSYLRLALNLAKSSSCKNKHGAVIAKGGSILSLGINKSKNHPDIIPENLIKDACHVHAEIDAIKKVKGSLRGATIYVARTNQMGKGIMSRPCDRCYEAITLVGITKIVYTD